MNELLNMQELQGLSDEEKKVALQILNELSQKGKSQTYEELLYDSYEEIPVTIEEFLYNRDYLGNGVIDPEGKMTVFPYWIKTLKEIFPDNLTTNYNTLILTGSIGLGKSFVAVVCMLYLLYRMLCLKDPYLYYGLQPIDKITFSLMNITLDAAKGVAWDKMQQLVQCSPWFLKHGKLKGTSNINWEPEKGIELILGSRNNHIIGRAVFCLDGETIINTTDGNYKIKDLVGKSIKVRNIDKNGKVIISDECTVAITGESDEEYEIELEDESILKCTPNHKFMLKNGFYKEAQYLTKEDELFDIDVTIKNNDKIKIRSIKKNNLNPKKQYYDILNANPYNNFLIKTKTKYIISHNCNFTDEVNFGVGNDVEKLKQKQKTLISQVDARMQSRFMKGSKLPTLNIIASSKRSEQSFLETYIEMKTKNESKRTKIVDEPQWVVRNDKGSPDDEGAFYVAVGSRYLPSELLPLNTTEEQLNEYRNKGYKEIKKIPPGYYQNFVEDIDIALTDIAGVSATNSMKFISGARWKEIKNTNYKNPFYKDVIEVGNANEDKAQYSDFFDLNKVPTDLKSKPLFIHLDMSTSGDKTGIAGVWIVGKKIQKEGESPSKELFYRVAFSVSIQAPKGYQISYEKNRNFIRWLRESGFKVRGVSCDSYNSAQIMQQLKAENFDVSLISVDRLQNVEGTNQKICLPYHYLRTAINEKQLEVYDFCPQLTEEIVNLERLSNGKIEHPDEGKSGSKDQADALAGALYNASQHGEEFAFDYGETLELTIDANSGLSGESEKQQLQVAFEEEIQNMFNPMKNYLRENATKNTENKSTENNAKFIENVINKENNTNKENKEESKKDKPTYLDFGMGPAQVLQGQQYIQNGIMWW